jgi:hypothetical protein
MKKLTPVIYKGKDFLFDEESMKHFIDTYGKYTHPVIPK